MGSVMELFMELVMSLVMWLVMVSITSSHNSDQMCQCLMSQKSHLCPKSKEAVVPEGYMSVPEGYLLVPEGYLYKG